ncbi:menaquinone biosynthesis decarboxylase [Chitinophaga caeni]|uniref:Menaquinone biosynthesis decarboxylase n=1 Tax=Chitinophaga caeni TaxID=2029983 RepID=A0A291QWL8_9BACT|nr:menaquinone biosynthesis decarboxylase [Chitinophaga caeni]ATL48311.1 menaquinone biosynthesis decarboxylase [Chitinophaga caeni]
MAFKNLEHFINTLDQAGELVRIKRYVNPHLEIAEITDRVSKMPGGGKALLFENTGYDFPVLMNSMGSYKRMCLALGVAELDDIAREIEDLFKMLSKPKEGILDKLSMLPKLGQFASWMPKVVGGKGACQEVVMEQPDLSKLPVIQCWPKDGGPFITLPVIHTKDPHNGTRNVGMYRMQIFEKDLTGMHWHKHKVSAKHFNEYKALGKKMPVAVVLGGDPVYTYSATAPLPENVDEYMLAGFLRKKKVELVKCITQPELEVPADADFVIEGYVDPADPLIWEGPFGDHTGYYSLADWYPRFHVTAITHRKNAVYPATIVGVPPQEDAWIGKATERIFLAPIKMTLVPEIVDMEMPVEGVFHNLVISQIVKDYPGQAQKVMNAMWGAGQMMFNKILVVAGKDTPITDYKKLAQHVFKHLNPATDIYFSQGPMDVLDHSCSKMGFGGKMCIDGTTKFEEEIDERYHFPEAPKAIEVAAIQSVLPGITAINQDLLKYNIPCLILAVKKNKKGHIKTLNKQLFDLPALKGIKMLLYVEHTVDVTDLPSTLWRFCNNLDPKRDHFIEEKDSIESTGKVEALIGLDGTLKTKEWDNFQRDWPNIVVSDLPTIEKVDLIWNELNLGEFVASPSLKYRKQIYGDEAIVDI